MKNLLAAIVSEGLFNVIALLVLLALVWFGGEYLGYPVQLRIIVMLSIGALWLLLYLVQRVLAVRRAMRIEAMLRAQAAASPIADQRAGPLDTLTHQFRLGVQALRATRAGQTAVRHMPWFLVMGPPAAGKTAAVRESGLNFPFVGLGHRANANAGGTRTIDWWYADKAVFLDTAGAFAVDPARHGEWLALIRLLARTGRDRPVDGVVLVVSIAELLALDEDRIGDHAQNLRDRIDELASRLGMTFPVHLVFSQCDRLHGFSDFFEHFPLEQRGQAWGCTFAWAELGPQGLQERVDEEFRRLYQMLGLRRIEALAAGNTGNTGESLGDHQRNALLFPIQFALLQRRVGQYIAALTRPNPFQESGRLRGFWFTSAMQGGEPIDRVLGSLGLGNAAVQPVQPGEQRAYFLNAPFATIIPGDQGLARISARVLRRNRIACAVLALIAGGAAAIAGILLHRGYQQTETILDGLILDGRRLRSIDPVSRDGARIPADLADHLQRFSEREGIPLVLQPGLMFANDLTSKAREAYLANSVRPLIATYARRLGADLGVRLTAQERSLAGYEALHERFRVYLMLCGRIPADSEAVVRLYTASGSGAIDDTVAHLRTIITRLPSQEWVAQADATLVERTTRELRDALWITLTGVEIAKAGAGLHPATDLATLLAGRTATAFTLERPIPGFFSQRAWDGFIAHAIDERAQALARRFAELHIDLDAAAITRQLRTRHEEAFAHAWRALPATMRMQPLRTLDEAIACLGELGHEGSPYRTLILAWMQHRTLVTSPVDQTAAVVAAAKTAKPAQEAPAEARKLAWLDQALNAAGILHAALSSYATTCPADTRLANLAELDKAVTACATFAMQAETALAACPEEEPRRIFIGHFRTLAEEARTALEREPLLEAVRTVPGLRLATTREDLARRLQSVGMPAFPQLWRGILKGISAPVTTDPVAAATRLTNLAAPQSPYATLLRAAWRGQQLKPQLISAKAGVSVDQGWNEQCFQALGVLAAAYAPVIDAEPGPRVAREDALKRLAEAFAVSERGIGTALASLADEELRTLVARPFRQILDDARHHLHLLLAADADRLWNDRVRAPFLRDCATAFPFRLVPTDADPKLVTAFLAPKTGTLWETGRILAAAERITIAGQPLIRLDAGYQRALTAARALGAVLFAPDSDRLALSFTVELRQHPGVFQALVALGKEQFELSDTPDGRHTFTCSPAEALACRIAIQVADGRWLEQAAEPQPWGLLRWAQGGHPVADGTGGLRFTWPLVDDQAPPSARVRLIQLAISDQPMVALFSRRVFEDLAFPATITVRPQER